MRRLLPVAMSLLILTACAKPPVEPQPEATAQPDKPAQTTPAPNTPEPANTAPKPKVVEAVPLPAGMRKVEMPAGQAMTEPGLYYMDLATGELEAWLTPPQDPAWPMGPMETTPDHRWLTMFWGSDAYLIRRSDGQAFRYNQEQHTVTVGPNLFLFAHRSDQEKNTYIIMDDEMQQVSTFTLDRPTSGSERFLFSPDGKGLAVTHDQSLTLIDVATGSITQTLKLQGDPATLTALPDLGEMVVTTASYNEPMHIYRINWQGQLLGEQQVNGYAAAFSRDGKLLATAQYMGDIGAATVVQEWGSETPLFRVAGSLGFNWLPNATGLITDTRLGWQLVTMTGEMGPVPGGEPGWKWFKWYRPSPTDPDLFLTDTRVLNRAGAVVQAASVPANSPASVTGAGWSTSGDEVHFAVTYPLGRGFDIGMWTMFLPRLQRWPFPETYPLEVRDPKGECLNLRETHAANGTVIRCLPTGTRMEPIGPVDQAIGADGFTWLNVKTEQGETGWVAMDTDSISYAD